MSPRRSSAASWLAVSALSLACALLVAEVAARWMGGRAAFRNLHELRPGEPWLYGLRPGAVARNGPGGVDYRINDLGFRDVARSVDKPPATLRVAVLGDSVTFGYGVERTATYPVLAEAALAGVSPRAVEVLNFGVNGYNAYNEAELYRGSLHRFDADLVLVQFCINDLNDPTFHFDASTVQRLGELPPLAHPNPRTRRPPPAELSRWLQACHRSHLCSRLMEARAQRARAPTSPHEVRASFEIREGGAFETEWRWLRDRYRDLAAAAEAHGARFGVIAFPHEAEIAAPGGGATRERLLAMADREAWLAIDLLPAFRDAARRGDGDLFLDLWHPTARGHAVAGEALARQLSCRGLIPGASEDSCD